MGLTVSRNAISRKEGAIRHDCDKEKELNIEHKFVSMGGRENHDKEQFNGTGAKVGLRIYEWVG